MKHLPLYLGMALLGVAGSLTYQHYQQVSRLNEQLAHSAAMLNKENTYVAVGVEGRVNMMRAAVEKNRNYPPDVVYLHRAEALHAQVTSVLAALHDCAGQLRHLANADTVSGKLQRPGYRVFTTSPSPALERWQQSRRQVAACSDSLHHASGAARRVALPTPGTSTTAVQALADLAIAGHRLLDSETHVLSRLDRKVAYRQQVFEFMPVATAESNVVHPGGTYHARLHVATHAPADLRQHMTYNGRPVAVDSLGIGRVRFRAPLRPGPAVWTGTIRTQLYGRDTTFVVRVPYRVAAR